MNAGRVTIHRRGGPKLDPFRGYRILVNGLAVGKLRRGGSLTVEQAPPLAVLVRVGQETVAEARNARGLAGALVARDTPDPESYLLLELVSGTVAPAGPRG